MFTIIYPKNNHGILGCKIEKALSDLRQQEQEQRCGRLFKTNVKQYTKKNETKKKQNIINRGAHQDLVKIDDLGGSNTE